MPFLLKEMLKMISCHAVEGKYRKVYLGIVYSMTAILQSNAKTL